MNILRKNKIENYLKKLQGWQYKDNKIYKTFRFDNYMESIDFINSLAKKAEESNHHPDMVVGWCQIDIAFTSHEYGAVTASCIEMAKVTESIK